MRALQEEAEARRRRAVAERVRAARLAREARRGAHHAFLERGWKGGGPVAAGKSGGPAVYVVDSGVRGEALARRGC